MGSKHLTKKQIKEDNIRPALESAAEWLVDNVQMLAVGLGAVIVVSLGVYGFQTYQESAQAEQQLKLAEALRVLEAPIGTARADPAANRDPS